MFKLTIIALGSKMPNWVNDATTEFMKRLQEFAQVNLVEIPLTKRKTSHDLTRISEKESLLIINAIPKNAYTIALCVEGVSYSSTELAKKLSNLQNISNHVCLLIGGPEGLSDSVKAYSQESWSLSKLTLPHTLVRIVLLETIYRAFTINNNHPYHK